MRQPTSLTKLFDYPATFVKTVVKSDGLPIEPLPEVAFAGRSNVGKSSLLNALFNQHQLARASNTPGRTQALNFFRIRDFIYFVDMPGYGYARASHSEIAQWLPMIQDYITHRPLLRRIYLLIDARHGFKPNDLEFMHYLDLIGLPYQIVLTKADKLNHRELTVQVDAVSQAIAAAHIACFPTVIVTSASKKAGLADLKQSIIDLINPADNRSR